MEQHNPSAKKNMQRLIYLTVEIIVKYSGNISVEKFGQENCCNKYILVLQN